MSFFHRLFVMRVALFLSFLFLSPTVHAGEEVVYSVSGMHCGRCPQIIENIIEANEYVRAVSVDVKNEQVAIKFLSENHSTALESIKTELRKKGYNLEIP